MSGHAVPRYLRYFSERMHVVVPALSNKQADCRVGYTYIQSIRSEGGRGGRWWGEAGEGGGGRDKQPIRQTEIKTKTDRRDRERTDRRQRQT